MMKGSGSRRPKNIRIWIRNTGSQFVKRDNTKISDNTGTGGDLKNGFKRRFPIIGFDRNKKSDFKKKT
jgi:hypothetical protein